MFQSLLSDPSQLAQALRKIIPDERTRICVVEDQDGVCIMHCIDHEDNRSFFYLAETIHGKKVWVKGWRRAEACYERLACIVHLSNWRLVVDSFSETFSRKIYVPSLKEGWVETSGPFSVKHILADLHESGRSNSYCSPAALGELHSLGFSGEWFEQVQLHEDRVILVPPPFPRFIDGHPGERAKMRLLYEGDRAVGFIFNPALEPKLADTHRIISPELSGTHRVQSQIEALTQTPHVPLTNPALVARVLKDAAIAARGEDGWRKVSLDVFPGGKCNLRVTKEFRKFSLHGMRCVGDLWRPESWGPDYCRDDEVVHITLTPGILTVDVYGEVMKRYIYLAYRGWELDRVCGSVEQILACFESGEVEDEKIIRAQLLQINPLFTACDVYLHKGLFRVVTIDGTERLVEHFRGMQTSWEVKSPMPPQSSPYKIHVTPERVFVTS